MKRTIFLVGSLAIILVGCATHPGAERELNSYLNDEVISGRVLRVLNDQPGFDRVSVTTTNGNVFLSGTVRSARDRERAGKLAAEVERVERVVNRTRIEIPTQR